MACLGIGDDSAEIVEGGGGQGDVRLCVSRNGSGDGCGLITVSEGGDTVNGRFHWQLIASIRPTCTHINTV